MMTVLSSFVEGDFFPKHPLALIARSVAFFGINVKADDQDEDVQKEGKEGKEGGRKRGKGTEREREKESKRTIEIEIEIELEIKINKIKITYGFFTAVACFPHCGPYVNATQRCLEMSQSVSSVLRPTGAEEQHELTLTSCCRNEKQQVRTICSYRP